MNFPIHPLFKGISKIFLKEIAPIECTKPATAVLVENGQVIIGEAQCGKGYVLAIGDPWLYNEYIGHFLLPADF
jgi:unsaturated rhamnogalacturonyl hydrolase